MHQEVTTITVPQHTRSYCGSRGQLALYDSVNDSAWLNANHPCNLHEWA